MYTTSKIGIFRKAATAAFMCCFVVGRIFYSNEECQIVDIPPSYDPIIFNLFPSLNSRKSQETKAGKDHIYQSSIRHFRISVRKNKVP